MQDNDKDDENIENNENLESINEQYEVFSSEDSDDMSLNEAKRMLKVRMLERKQRKGNIWLSNFFILVRLVLLVGVSYALFFLIKAPQWYVDKDIFTVSNPHLEIINNDIVPSYKILNELRKIPVTNEPIYKFEIDKIKYNLLEIEPIEDIYIRRFWFPARIQIIVKERVPLISIYNDINGPMLAFFTKDGVLIGDEYLPLPSNINTLKVLASGNFREWDKTKVNLLYNFKNYLETLSSEKIEYIDMLNPNDVYIKLPSYVLRVGRIDEGIYDRVSRLPSVLPSLKSVSEPVKYIDLRWKGSVYLKTE